MAYLRALILALQFLLVTVWTLALRVAGRPLHRGWTVAQEATVRLMRWRGANDARLPVPVLRRRLDELASLARVRPGKIEITDCDAGGVPAQWLAPPDLEPHGAPVVLYLHGGGYIFCSPVTHRLMMLRLARAARARVLGLHYRLAPEHPFPAAVDDAEAAYRWLLERGTEPGDIVLAGDSAGGGLALALMLRARERGLPRPAGAALISPWVDMTAADASLTEYAPVDYLGPVTSIGRMRGHYLGDADPTEPLVSPALADLAGLSPLLVQGGGVEILRGHHPVDLPRHGACVARLPAGLPPGGPGNGRDRRLLPPGQASAMTMVAGPSVGR